MIVLVLEHARREAFRDELNALARAVERAHADLGRAWHEAADVGNAETALPAFLSVLADWRDLRINQRDERHLAFVAHVADHLDFPHARDEHTHAFVYLRRRQAD